MNRKKNSLKLCGKRSRKKEKKLERKSNSGPQIFSLRIWGYENVLWVMEEVKKYLIREIKFRKDRKFERFRLSEEREDIFCESCKSRPGNCKNY